MSNPMNTPTLQAAIRYLAADDADFARELNGVGFNKPDSHLGHALAVTPECDWSPRQSYLAWKMLRKYREQLQNGGICYDELPQPPAVETRRVIFINGSSDFAVDFEYDSEIVAAVKRIPGARFNPQNKTWKVPALKRAIDSLFEFAADWQFDFDDAVRVRAEAVLAALVFE